MNVMVHKLKWDVRSRSDAKALKLWKSQYTVKMTGTTWKGGISPVPVSRITIVMQ